MPVRWNGSIKYMWVLIVVGTSFYEQKCEEFLASFTHLCFFLHLAVNKSVLRELGIICALSDFFLVPRGLRLICPTLLFLHLTTFLVY